MNVGWSSLIRDVLFWLLFDVFVETWGVKSGVLSNSLVEIGSLIEVILLKSILRLLLKH